MADGEEGQKTEEPTEHKLSEARKKGQVFKSTEVVTALQFAIMALVMIWTGGWAARAIMAFNKDVYRTIPIHAFRNSDVWFLLVRTIRVSGLVMLPLFAAAVIAGVLFHVAQTGVIFSAQPLTPTLDKISPVEGFKRLFSRKSFVELLKQLFKVAIIGWVSYKVLYHAIGTITGMSTWDLHAVVQFGKNLAFEIIWYVTAFYLVMAAADFVIQRKFFMTQMRMSIQELKDELKDTEGDPQVKARMRQLQRQLVEASLRRAVPQASAVVTNPTHLAVALEYRQGEMEAPVVTAKGERLVAERIRQIAVEFNVPIFENVGLARALFKACRVGQEIPGDLYRAVAEVLAFVYRMKRKRELAKRRAVLRIRESKLQKRSPTAQSA